MDGYVSSKLISLCHFSRLIVVLSITGCIILYLWSCRLIDCVLMLVLVKGISVFVLYVIVGKRSTT